MARCDLSEAEWRLIEPLLPNKPRGVARVDDRRVINGIYYVLRVHGGEKTIQWSACVCAGAGGVKVGHWIG